MTSEERRHCMRLLAQAQDGDEMACERLTQTLATHFAYMIRGFSTTDPAFDREDLHNEFRMGIWQFIHKVDGRGDPLYHLAWRGQRAVSTLLNTIKRRRYGTNRWIEEFGEPRSIGTLPEGFDLPDTHPETDPEYVLEVREGQDEARQHVIHVLARLRLTPRQHDVVDWMVSDPDIEGDGANLRLAERLGISPQAASKHRQTVMAMLAGQPEVAEVPRFPCPGCGREFKSRGALTQHRNGQSGHRPCEAVTR